ncbi:UNKNOWN [Stylonychia lemnae]|uniref:Uncharacterized protein n=1 Tax=Stylonychia lemnae TaxID=5949 RepID=A0A078ANX7_STYLE|nr:UNKNOWN [Stylonychia lemnae]|eukprot:CDW82663.1 UNKNOWN [Stylonychia lemnae]
MARNTSLAGLFFKNQGKMMLESMPTIEECEYTDDMEETGSYNKNAKFIQEQSSLNRKLNQNVCIAWSHILKKILQGQLSVNLINLILSYFVKMTYVLYLKDIVT